jgi:hypothetical protein
MPLAEAVVDAGAVRFRPMLLTALAVVVGASVILADPIFPRPGDLVDGRRSGFAPHQPHGRAGALLHGLQPPDGQRRESNHRRLSARQLVANASEPRVWSPGFSRSPARRPAKAGTPCGQQAPEPGAPSELTASRQALRLGDANFTAWPLAAVGRGAGSGRPVLRLPRRCSAIRPAPGGTSGL